MSTESTDYPILTPDRLALQALIAAMSRRAMFLHGGSGVGKSATTLDLGSDPRIKKVMWTQWAEANLEDANEVLQVAKGTSLKEVLEGELPDLEVIHLTIPQMEAEDFIGVPFHRQVEGKDMSEERMTAWAPAEFLRRNRPVILFLDETSAAETRVQKVLLQIVQERRVFNVALPEGTFIMLAGNRAIDRAGSKGVTFTLGNRCAHFTYVSSAASWTTWYLKQGLPSIFVAWVNQDPIKHMNGYVASDPSLAQLTARSLAEGAARGYKAAIEIGAPLSEIEATILANVGYAAGTSLNAWVRLREELPSWEEIRSTPETAKLPVKGKVDQAYFATSMLMDHFRADITEAEIGAVCVYLNRIATELPEVTDAVAWFGQSVAAMSREKQIPQTRMAGLMKGMTGTPLAAMLVEFLQAVKGPGLRKAS